jgi:hypothetical protein
VSLRLRILILFAFCAAPFGSAQQQAPASDSVRHEVRQHFSVTSPSGIDDSLLTRIQNLSEADDKTVVLIRTAAGGHFVAVHEWNYESQISYSEIRDQRSGDFLRLSVTYPYATRTRSSTLELARKNPKLVSREIPFEMTAPGNTRLSGIESHWRDPATAREWRTRARQMVSPSFLEDLEIIDSSGLFSDPMLSSLHQFLLQFVLYRTSCDSPAGLQVAPAVPDCSFDKEFGLACSEDQVSRAKAASEAKTTSRY